MILVVLGDLALLILKKKKTNSNTVNIIAVNTNTNTNSVNTNSNTTTKTNYSERKVRPSRVRWPSFALSPPKKHTQVKPDDDDDKFL